MHWLAKVALTILGNAFARRVKPIQHVVGRRDVVPVPDDHRHQTDLTVGDPTVVVLEVPRGENGRLAEVAAATHLVTCSVTNESFFTIVPATGLSDTTFVHVGAVAEAPGPVVL